MTGEITLSGQVFPVGGIKEKVLSAHRAGIRRIILPAQNESDIDDIPEDVRAELEIIPAKLVSQVLDAALEKDVTQPPDNYVLPTSDSSSDGGADRLIASKGQ
jgi:ATP-dependent Lon protease